MKFSVALISTVWCWLSLAGLSAAEPASPAPAKGQICFQSDFEGGDALRGWQGTAALGPGYSSARALAVQSGPGMQAATETRKLAVETMQGCTVRCTAMIRAQEVSAKPNAWNGVKFMLVIKSPAGTTYPQAALGTGTFEWQLASFTARIPADATDVSLVLGLEQVTGKAWFDEVKIAVSKPPLTIRPQPAAGVRFTGHDLPRLRGTMISPNINAESLRVLGQDWNANLIRWQLIRTGRAGQSDAKGSYDAWLAGELNKLEAALPLCEKLGILVVVDLHSPPGGQATAGGYYGSDHGLFSDPQCQEKFVQVWRGMTARFKGAKAIWGFDLVNEPVEEDVGEGCDDWQALAERCARAIREIDPRRTLIVEPTHWGSPEGLSELVPLPISNVVYSVHMYVPHAFTHQGVFAKGPSYTYPGRIEGKQWDKAALEHALEPAIDFQRRYNVQIYIGEFSAIRWAPDDSACRYLSDLIDIFEAHGWDWSYHAFREWSGWSVEHGADPKDTEPAASPTSRERLLRGWFARNQKPQW
jgi:endoglucanase